MSPPTDRSDPDLPEPHRELAHALRRSGVGDVRFDRVHRVLYSTDASIYQVEPVGVVIPRDLEEILATVTVCGQYGVPVLARGGGSSLAGQAVGQAVVVDTSRHLDGILEVDAAGRRVRCQPGIALDRLNAALRPHELMVGPDPASSDRATVGGTVGNNGTGAHSILYGMIADHVLAAQAVLADGHPVVMDDHFLETTASEGLAGHIRSALPRILKSYREDIRRDFPRHWRRASGYNLDKLLDADRPNPAQLLAGSEGTLGFLTEVTLNLVARPRRTVVGVVHFDDLVASAEATVAILELQPSAVELMDRFLMNLCRRRPEYARRLTFVEGDPACVLGVEFYVESESEARARLDELGRHLAARGHHGLVVPLLDAANQANLWAVRKAGLNLLLSQRGDAKPVGIIEDVAVPPEHLADYIRGVLAMFAGYGKEAAFYAHASAGCLHIRPLLNLKDAGDIALVDAMQARVLELIRPWGGVLSGEHGDGLKHTRRNSQLFGPRLTRAFAEVKLAFDPANLFNPGKKVPVELLEEVQGMESGVQRSEVARRAADLEGYEVPDPGLAVPGTGQRARLERGEAGVGPLRFGSNYRTVEIRAHFDWSADGGFARAVEMCNGSGVCRKLDVGVMCPSFQGLREEEHSTRGRANLLRAALSGHLPPAELTGDRLHQALDLCLGCKACKTECPSSVDLAKIKSEVLAQRYEQRGTPLSARLFGHIHALNRLAAPVAPLANAAVAWGPVRWLIEQSTGLHPARSLPPFASQTFPAWFEKHSAWQTATSGPLVLLFPDTFMTYNYPEIGVAAVRVLEAAGFRVELAPRVCCGRPMLSQGLVEDARRHARQNVDLLYPLAAQGLPILVCEPSCAAAFHDEYRDLLPGDSRVTVLAGQVCLLDDWLARQLDQGLALPLRPQARQVLFHGHCHQKASVGTAGSLAVLRAVPGQEVSQIDAGCCGMAGAFGYTAGHYDLSAAIANDRLMPAIQAAPEAVICADGASCRQQIQHFSGRPARHVIEVLADALLPG